MGSTLSKIRHKSKKSKSTLPRPQDLKAVMPALATPSQPNDVQRSQDSSSQPLNNSADAERENREAQYLTRTEGLSDVNSAAGAQNEQSRDAQYSTRTADLSDVNSAAGAQNEQIRNAQYSTRTDDLSDVNSAARAQNEQSDSSALQHAAVEASRINNPDGLAEHPESPIQLILRRDTESIAGSLTRERNITNHVPSHNEPSPLQHSIVAAEADQDSDYAAKQSASPRASILSRRISGTHLQMPMNRDPGLPRRSPSLSSSAVNNEDAWPELVPLKVKCLLELSLDDSTDTHLTVVEISWYDKDAWHVLHNEAWIWLNQNHLSAKNKWQHVTLQHGSFRVVGKYHDSSPRKLELGKHVPEVLIVPVCGFISNYLREPFHIHLRWHFDSLNLDGRGEDDYRDAISNELSRKKKLNIENRIFFSRHALNYILPPHAAEKIIDEDTSFIREPDELRKFKERLQDCNRLLLLCIWQRLNLKVLKKVLDHDPSFNDEEWPCEEKCNALKDLGKNWEAFKEVEPAFRRGHTYQFPLPKNLTVPGSAEIDSLPGELHLPRNKVVPVCYASKDEKQIGKGGYSQVLAVKIDPSYQTLTQDKEQTFALKVFQSDVLTDRAKKAKKFAHEKKVLEKLRSFAQAPEQKHIVTHFAAWSQGENFYILFPMATGNLATFMNCLPCERPTQEKEDFKVRFERNIMPFYPDTKVPVLDSEFVSWYFTQMKGLSEAMYHLHHLMGDSDPRERSTRRLQIPGGDAGRLLVTGYHHDIKPDNILVFMESRIGYGTFKFGDFGSANIVETDPTIWKKTPAFTKKLRGAATFQSPDSWCDATRTSDGWDDGPLTRQADIWTLGCVFLELLIWCLEPRDEEKKKTFSEERAEDQSVSNNNIPLDKYWSRDPECLKPGNEAIPRKAVLKPAVVRKFEHLKQLCSAQNMHAFRDLIDLTRKMMSTISDKRYDSEKVKTRLALILDNVTTSLSKNANWFCGDVDPALIENLEKRVLYEIPPPSPSTDPQRRKRYKPIPPIVPLDQGSAWSTEEAQEALQHTQGQFPAPDTGVAADLLSGSAPGDRALRGRAPATLLGGANFVPRSRSSSYRSGSLPLRRHLSDPENPYTDPQTGHSPQQQH